MSRSQQSTIENTASGDNSADQTAATTAQKAESNDIGNYQAQLSKYNASNPFSAGGEYQTSQDQTLAGTADAGSAAITNQAQTQAARTGQNQAGAVAAGAEAGRANLRDLSSAEGAANQQRIGSEASYDQSGLAASALPAQLEGSMASTDYGAAGNSLNTAEQAAQAPDFWDELGAGFAGGLGTMGAAGIGIACPAAGSLFLMADGSRKLVEELVVGDHLQGIDGDSQAIEEIESAVARVLLVKTDNGLAARNSMVHAFALPRGGFTVASKCLGKTILTELGPAKVVSVEPDGMATIFNIITDGSHSYQADGVWALGVGEAERHVSMETWNRIGEQLAG